MDTSAIRDFTAVLGPDNVLTDPTDLRTCGPTNAMA
jgi:hypothetical protein